MVNNITSILKQPLNDKDLEAMSDITVLSEETINILERSLPDFVNYLSSLSRENKPLSSLDMEFIKVAGKSVAIMLYTVDAVADEQKRVWLNDRQPRGFDVGFHSVEWLKAVAMFFPDVIKCDLNQILTYKVSEETPNNFNRYLPSEIDTEQARKYFARAVAAGLMSEQYKWLASHAKLGYFCCKSFEQPRPITALEQFFGLKNLAASITQASYEPKRGDVKKWRAELDRKIFFD